MPKLPIISNYMNKTYLLLGSNLNNPAKQLKIARELIKKELGPIGRQSAVYSTAAWGKHDQPDFQNQVLIIETKQSPQETMQTLLAIESKMGRVRQQKNDPRIIDLDILFYNKCILNEPLVTLPHPHIANRRFVLVPLNELSPNLIHPVHQKTIHQLLRVCKDTLPVNKM